MDFVRQSWLFPVIESIHLIGLTMLVGTIALMDFRLLGIASRGEPAKLGRWTFTGFAVVLVTGPLMFWSDLSRYIHNPAFVLKMGILAVAFATHFTLHRRAVRDDAGSVKKKLTAVLSLILWSSVVLAGKAIADLDIK